MAQDIPLALADGDGFDGPDWKGTERFEIVRRIGRGGMGVVYEARDLERGRCVAVKTLLHVDPASLYQFKQEFRALAGVTHMNLVRLHELVATEDAPVLFSMELVRGDDFMSYVQWSRVRPRPSDSTSWDRTAASTRHAVGPKPSRDGIDAPETIRQDSPADLDRLMPALRQLVEGVRALHAAGKLHRDIKPSNVLVTAEGRVVILDFGVATDFRTRAIHSENEGIVGTATYMAPEQAFEGGLTPAADWYSVGVMLYEALVGVPPFTGDIFHLISVKNSVDAEPPSAVVDGVPPELDALCHALLSRSPEARPTADEILHRLGATRSSSHAGRPTQPPEDVALIGRTSQLRALRDTYRRTLDGQTVTLRVGGRSGMGKSTLIEHFLDSVEDEAIVVRGRAYERESVPYKAVDSLVDALSRALLRLSGEDRAIPMPEGVGALAHLFPVLRRVPEIGAVPVEKAADPPATRRRAFAAFRELSSILARRAPLVLYIDDAQWGDTDSAAMLLDLVRPPHAPPLLLLLAHREEDATSSAFLNELRARWPPAAPVDDVAVGALDPASARALAFALLGESDRKDSLADAVAVESGGSPFLVGELARYATKRLLAAADEVAAAPGSRITIEQVIADRMNELPGPARRLVEIIAVGGRPVPLSTLADAAGVQAIDDDVALLSARRFVRPGLRDGREVAEPVHDRVRETIVALLSPETLREHHGRLASVLEKTRGADPEAVAVHLLGAGQVERAGRFADRAAKRAAALFAFDQAARLYRMAIASLPRESPRLGRLYGRLSRVLEWAGRHDEAAQASLEASERAVGGQRLALETSASLQLLLAGRVDEGLERLRRILTSIGVNLPATPKETVTGLLTYRAAIERRGLHFRERPENEVPEADRARIDALHVIGLGLVAIDTSLAYYMQTRILLEALDAGERSRILRATTLYYSVTLPNLSSRITRHERDVQALLHRLLDGAKVEDLASSRSFEIVPLFNRGRFRETVAKFDEAVALLPPQQASMLARREIYAVYALGYLGELHEVRRRTERLVVEAEDRHDRVTPVMLKTAFPLLWLADDDPETARVRVREGKAPWGRDQFTAQHWQEMRVEADIELYVGNGAAAYERLERDDAKLRASTFLIANYGFICWLFVRGRAAAASADAAGPEREARLVEARECERRLRAQGLSWTDALGAVVAASIANVLGDRSAAEAALREAIGVAESAEMSLYAAAARHQLGLLLGDDRGRDFVERAEATMRAQGVRAPARFASFYVPGRWRVGRD